MKMVKIFLHDTFKMCKILNLYFVFLLAMMISPLIRYIVKFRKDTFRLGDEDNFLRKNATLLLVNRKSSNAWQSQSTQINGKNNLLKTRHHYNIFQVG